VIDAALYVVAHALAAVVGLPVLWLSDVRSWSVPARAAGAFAAGAVWLAIVSTLSSLLGLRWSLVLLAPSVAAAVVLGRRFGWRALSRPFRPGRAVGALGIIVAGIAATHLVLSLVVARATSTDFLLFWGVKAIRFARARSIDPVLLTSPFFGHSQPFYPPLLPTLDAWAALLAGRMPWRTAPVVTALWFAAAAALLLEIARRRLGDRNAVVLVSFWMAAFSASLVASLSGGNAEAPLLLYETTAAALLLTEGPVPGAGRRTLVGVFLAGAVLTKVEGSVGAALLIGGTLLRDALSRRLRLREIAALVLPPLTAGLVWLAYVRRFHIPVTAAPRARFSGLYLGRIPHVLSIMIRRSDGGDYWLPWLVPALLLLIGAHRAGFRRALPALVAAVGLAVFFVFLYLHDPGDQSLRIGWEIPRLGQPVLSLFILLAAFSAPPFRSSLKRQGQENTTLNVQNPPVLDP